MHFIRKNIFIQRVFPGRDMAGKAFAKGFDGVLSPPRAMLL